MVNLNQPNTAFLDDPANRESQPLDYAVLSLQWLYWSWRDGNSVISSSPARCV